MEAVVADASAIVSVLVAAGPTPFDRYFVPESDLHAPAVCDVEVAAALTCATRLRRLSGEAVRMALLDYASLPITRHAHLRLLGRAYVLRHNFTVADAMYVALAESLGATLLTADRRLGRTCLVHTSVRVLP